MVGIDDILGSALRGGARGIAAGARASGLPDDGLNRFAARDELLSGLLANRFEREHGSGWGQAGRLGGQIIGTLPIAMAAGPVAGGVLRGAGSAVGAPAAGNTLARIVTGVAGTPQMRMLPTGAMAQTAGSTLGRIGSLAARGALEGAATAPFLPPEQDVTGTLPMSRSEMLSAPVPADIGERIATGAALGAVAGPLAQGIANVGRGAVRAALGGVGDQEGAALARLARERYGIEIEPGQLTGNRLVRYANEVSAAMPFSGGTATRQQQRAALVRALAHTFGEQADAVTPEVIQNARTRLGDQFDNTIQQIGGIGGDVRMLDGFDDVLSDAEKVLQPGELAPLKKTVEGIVDKFSTSNPTSNIPELTSGAYAAMTNFNSPLPRLLRSKNPDVRYYAGLLREELMGAAERRAQDPQAVQALQQLRGQWRNMLRVERAADPATGAVSAPKLLNSLRANGEARPGDDLTNLARVGSRFMRGMPESGTAERNLVQQTFGRLGQVVGPSVIPGIGLSGMGAAAGAGALGAIGPIAAIGGTVGIPIAARAVRAAINNPLTTALAERAPAVLSNPLSQAIDAGAVAVRRALPVAMRPATPHQPLQIEIVGNPATAPGFVDVRSRRFIQQAQGAR